MKQIKYLSFIFLMALVVIFPSSCSQTQSRVSEAQTTVVVPDKSNYTERKQVADAEILNDKPGKVYWWYILADDGKLVTSITCIGRPVSSTESLEPNNTQPSGTSIGWLVPLEEGQKGYTTEMMGLDGTYGEPVPFRYCMTPEGHYFDVSMMQKTIVSSIPLTFPQPEVRFDQQLEAKKLIAEKTIKDGGCIDSNLNPINCAEVKRNKSEDEDKK